MDTKIVIRSITIISLFIIILSTSIPTQAGESLLVRIYKNNTSKAYTDVLFSNSSSFGRKYLIETLVDVGDWRTYGSRVQNIITDVDGDGHGDLVRIFKKEDSKAYTDILFGTGYSFGRRPGVNTLVDVGDWSTHGSEVQNIATDVDGDRRGDLIRIFKRGNGKAYTDILFGNGISFARKPGVNTTVDIGDWSTFGSDVKNIATDVDGDGHGDLVRIFKKEDSKAYTDILFGTGYSFGRRPGVNTLVDVGDWSTHGSEVQNIATDVDGDRRGDLIRIFKRGNGKAYTDILFGNGISFARKPGVNTTVDIGDWVVGGDVVVHAAADVPSLPQTKRSRGRGLVGGLFEDLGNLVRIGEIAEFGRSIDEAHARIKDAIPIYSDIEEQITDAAQQFADVTCSIPYQVLTNAVIAKCSNWAGRLDDAHVIENAKKLLIGNGIFTAQDFIDVEIRWCPLVGAHGMAPDRGKIYLDVGRKNDGLKSLAALLAHEMKHIQQYRTLGTDDFKCKYSEKYLACGGCQNRSHSLELEAYDFQDKVFNGLVD
ncbi:MAG: hypothetical protein AB2689_22605 [Candidatus Thiodiazotropha taylori]